MKYAIPVRTNTDAYTMSVELSGVVYGMGFKFNARDQHWYLSLFRDDVDIVQGVKLVHTEDLLSQYHAYDIPAGKLSIVDITGQDRDPDAINFGDTVLFQYTE